MKVLGVTGGTGVGKTVVCRMLKEQGGKIIDADKIAANMRAKGTRAYKEIVEFFGEGILRGDGEIDTKILAGIVFNDKKMLLKLNAIVHKHVAAEIKRRVALYRTSGERLVVLDVPIPIEEGFFDTVDNVWAVVANDDLRIERLKKRSGLTEEEAQLRIASQMSNREYEEISDVVIYNEDGPSELKKLVLYELRRFLES